VVWHGAEYLEFGFEILAQIHDGRNIAATVAVVWCGPDGDDVLVFEVVLQTVSIFRGDGG
jgi:hypothetical protein